MVKYPGAFSGLLISRPESGLDCYATQKVNIQVSQNSNILSSITVCNIDSQDGQIFDIEFEYQSLIDPVQLVIELGGNDQFNRDNPIELNKLKIDDLYTVPKLLHIGQVNANDQCIDTGNVLWCTGKLIYNFILPISGMIVEVI